MGHEIETMSGTQYETAVIDNGKYGKRTIRFETGRLAQQAQGAASVYIDEETMLFSATTASKQPKDQFDFFPLTIDVEERMYAAGKIPGSFFRREGRPTTEAILACRLIDRPLRPSFVDGLRNEVQVVVTVMAIHPDELYDVVAINAASMSTQLAGLPFSGPIGGVRVALIDDQWVAFPKHSQLERAVFDMVVAGRVIVENGVEDVAIMMVEAEATENTWDLVKAGATAPSEAIVAQGLEASKPFIKELVAAQSRLAAKSAKPLSEYPVFPPYTDEVYEHVAKLAEEELGRIYLIADKQERHIPLSDGQKSALKNLDMALGKARLARMRGKVDVEAVKAISPESFADVPEDQHEALARNLMDSVGILKETAQRKIIDDHPQSAKLDDVSSYAAERKGKPGVVFAHSRAAVANIAKRLQAEGHRVVTITGDDSSKEKDAKRLMFKPETGEPKADILVMSDAGAVGLNAQRGKWLYQYDTPSTAKTHAQRIGRINRIGQDGDIELADGIADHPSERRARDRLKKKYALRDIMTSPMEGLDDTGLAYFIRQRQVEKEQGGLF